MEWYKVLTGELSNIIVGVLAFLGAYLGTKRIKRHLIDDYIETRVNTSRKANDAVLSESRKILSFINQSDSQRVFINEKSLRDTISFCEQLSELAEDGSKEVATTTFLLYNVIRDLKPEYKNKAGNFKDPITSKEIRSLIGKSLRLIIYYCTVSAPIPFNTNLKKGSRIRRKLRRYLSDKNFYKLKHQSFGITLNPNSETILSFSAVVSKMHPFIFSKNLFTLLQDNFLVAYELVIHQIYMPLILESNEQSHFPFIDNYNLHLIKFTFVRDFSPGKNPEEFVEFYYSNLSIGLIFVKNLDLSKFKEKYQRDYLLKREFLMNDDYQVTFLHSETIKIRVKLNLVKENFKNNRWRLRYKMLRYKASQK